MAGQIKQLLNKTESSNFKVSSCGALSICEFDITKLRILIEAG